MSNGRSVKDYPEEPYLDKRLAVYAQTDYYPFHMPGHKRMELDSGNVYQTDITEIEGFDNLHYAQDILWDAQERLRNLYKSKRAYYLINGSTCGILSAIGALAKPGDEILIARNCHKSVYHAVKLFRLKTHYVYPALLDCGIQGAVKAVQVEDALKQYPRIRLVVITSPTYEGIVSDIQKIADLSHDYHFYLIVDEAHGAHFSLSSYFPESAVCQNADIVIQSLHKTLPALTQTAVLHIASERPDCNRVEEMLDIFQTSSPSYVLMAGIERCVRLLEQSGTQLFEQFHERLMKFYAGCRNLKCLHVMTQADYGTDGVFAVDASKIVISTKNTVLDGSRLYGRLLQQYHLQMEMYSAEYVLAMTSIMDTEEGMERLLSALRMIDRDLLPDAGNTGTYSAVSPFSESFLKRAYAAKKKVVELWDTGEFVEEKPFMQSVGKISAEYVYLYPPGIPMIVPGEIIPDELIWILEECLRMGLNISGMRDKQCRKILTVAQHADDSL